MATLRAVRGGNARRSSGLPACELLATLGMACQRQAGIGLPPPSSSEAHEGIRYAQCHFPPRHLSLLPGKDRVRLPRQRRPAPIALDRNSKSLPGGIATAIPFGQAASAFGLEWQARPLARSRRADCQGEDAVELDLADVW